jgi:phage protein D
MINQTIGKNPRGTKYTVKFPTLPSLTVAPSKITINQKMYAHDVVTLEYPSISSLFVSVLKTGVPIQIDWKQGTRTNSWVGYVSYVSKDKAAQSNQPMTIRCVGASFELKQSNQLIFKNKTIPEVAAELAKKSGFSFITDKASTAIRYEQMALSGETYWEWITANAKNIGYGVYASGTRLFFRPLKNILDEASTDVPILQMWRSDIPSNVAVYDRTLYSFKVLNGEYVEWSESTIRSQKLTAGINPLTGKNVSAKADPKRTNGGLRQTPGDSIFNDPLVTTVNHDEVMAKANAEGNALLAQFSLPAFIKGQGDPRIAPFKPVYVEGTGKESDGYWMVAEVTHTLHIKGEYTIEATILTDGSGPSQQTIYRQTTPSIAGTVNLREAVLKNKNRVSGSPAKLSVLRARGPIIQEGNQGYNRTPTKWKATARSRAEGR